MHELAITQEIVATIRERIGAAAVSRVVLEIGAISGVMPQAVRFCFEVCAQDTTLEGARLEILEIPARAKCRDCAAVFEPDRFIALCPCGSANLEMLGGRELRIKEVDIHV